MGDMDGNTHPKIGGYAKVEGLSLNEAGTFSFYLLLT